MSLPLIQPQDAQSRAVFNNIIAQVNKGLFKNGSAVVDANGSTVTIPASQVSGRVQFVVGSYIGDGLYTRTFNVGFQPKLVICVSRAAITGDTVGSPYSYGYVGLGTRMFAPFGNEIRQDGIITMTDTGWSFEKINSSMSDRFNRNGVQHSYIAFR